ncbi:MAG TPA: type II toxin-antitoxin system VapB family antitoxin [Spirochaetota bacterium]|nr:type II toxin-antitoxin system VapB family antitoxin [Spirochaetota bacterium]HOM10453.1 type II toxin-antitoxin system VapB family antitoxin [Spirochaetota bacterium]HPP50200.1 type II toxin-antitoxin system VapB family antitoxin [Spirochaetota bacterium]
MLKIAKVFKNGRSQAIRIPKEFKITSKEVYIEQEGNKIIIYPKYDGIWDAFFQKLKEVDTNGFLEERNQLPLQKRDILL